MDNKKTIDEAQAQTSEEAKAAALNNDKVPTQGEGSVWAVIEELELELERQRELLALSNQKFIEFDENEKSAEQLIQFQSGL